MNIMKITDQQQQQKTKTLDHRTYITPSVRVGSNGERSLVGRLCSQSCYYEGNEYVSKDRVYITNLMENMSFLP